jgi:enoyl-CoA hydratase/carnithine racemase
MLSPDQALSIGLCDAVAGDVNHSGEPGDESQALDKAVGDFLKPILRQAPQVLRSFKAVVVAGRRGVAANELYELETDHFTANWVHSDHWAAADLILKKSDEKE